MEYNFNGQKFRERRWVFAIAGVVGFVVIVVGGYLIWKALQVEPTQPKTTAPSELPRMANQPLKKMPIAPPPPPSYTPDAPLLEQARQALREGITPAKALALAKSLPESPERADAAFLLLEYAADNGNAEAALEVGRYYDPTDQAPSGTIRKNPETAYGWYKEALTGGQDNAGNHLAQLRGWVEEQARQGSSEARDLLNTWR